MYTFSADWSIGFKFCNICKVIANKDCRRINTLIKTVTPVNKGKTVSERETLSQAVMKYEGIQTEKLHVNKEYGIQSGY